MKKSLNDYEEKYYLWKKMYNKQLKMLDNKYVKVEEQIIRTDVITIM